MSNIIHIEEKECDLDIYQCIDCGAYADKENDIKHHDSCTEGEAKKWENFYKNNQEEDYQ